MKGKVFSVKGEEIRDIDLSEVVFGCEVSEGSIYYAIRNELANMRVGTAETKTRSLVNGTRSKPWVQKGTGRARAGDKRSPVWVGGGTIFGPHKRDYSYSIPKKMKRLALRSILSLRLKENNIKFVEDFTVESGRTKDFAAILKNLISDERTVIILKDDDQMVKRAGNNIPWVSFLSYNRLRAHDLFYGKNILILESAVNGLNEMYGNK